MNKIGLILKLLKFKNSKIENINTFFGIIVGLDDLSLAFYSKF